MVAEPTTRDALLHQPCSCPEPWRPCSYEIKQIPYTHSTEPIHTLYTQHTLHVQTEHTRPLHTPLYITQTLHVTGWERARRNHGQGAGRVVVTEWSREGGISACQVPTPSWLLETVGVTHPAAENGLCRNFLCP